MPQESELIVDGKAEEVDFLCVCEAFIVMPSECERGVGLHIVAGSQVKLLLRGSCVHYGWRDASLPVPQKNWRFKR